MRRRTTLAVLAMLTVLTGSAVALPSGAEGSDVPTHHIRGSVSSDPPSSPGYGYSVSVEKPNGGYVTNVFTTSGAFDVEVPDGTYVLYVSMTAGGRHEYYRGAQSRKDADTITVAGADIDLQPWFLPRLHDVRGVVEAAGATSGMPIVAFPAGPDVVDYTQEKPYYSATFPWNGHYWIRLPAGTWKILFTGQRTESGEASPYQHAWAEEWFGDASSYSDATPIEVDGDLDLPPFTMSTGGALSGRVLDQATGEPLRKIDVQALDADGRVVSTAVTLNDGTYVVPDVHAGPHSVRVADEQGHTYLPQTSAPMVITEGMTAVRGDTVLVRAPLPDPADVDLSGTVTDQDGKPERGVGVTAYASCADHENGRGHVAVTDLSGHFSFTGLEPGSYKLFYSDYWGLDRDHDDGDANFELRPSWFGHADFCGPATAVATGGTADIQLVRNGGLTGTVTTESGGPLLLGGSATVHREDGGAWDTTSIQDDGSFTFGYLPPDTYTIYFGAPTDFYVPTWWKDVKTRAAAMRVTVGPGVMRGGIDGHAFNKVRIDNHQLPVVTGQPHVGATLTVSDHGTWLGRITDYSYTWFGPRDGYYTAVGTGPTYVVQPADLGDWVYAEVTASGPDDSSAAVSNSVGPIGAAPPPTSPPPAAPDSTTPVPLTRHTSATDVTGRFKEGRAHRRSRAVLDVDVRLDGSALPAAGYVTVTERGRSVAGHVRLVDGHARVVIKNPTPRVHRYVVRYVGDRLTIPSHARVRVDAG
jgi:hypothetical protein